MASARLRSPWSPAGTAADRRPGGPWDVAPLRSPGPLEAGRAVAAPAVSILELYWSEMSRRFHATAMRATGPVAPPRWGAEDGGGGGRWRRSSPRRPAAPALAGTDGVPLDVVVERVPGLLR